MKKTNLKNELIVSDLLVEEILRFELKKEANHYISWQLTDRQICDLELLLNGGFTPLDRFMNRNDYESVLNKMRLADGSLWPIPIVLDITEEFSKKIKDEKKIALRDKEGFPLAVLTISDIWTPNLEKEAKAIYGTVDPTHPAVNYLFNISN